MTTSKPPYTRTGGDRGTDPLDSTYFAVADIEGIAKNTIRAAHPADRQIAWQTFKAALEDEAELSESRMPWEDISSVTRVTAGAAVHALKAMLGTIPGEDEQRRLAKVCQREAERVEQRQEADGEHGPGIGVGRYPPQHCAYAKCGRLFRPRGPSAKFCSPACRQAAYKARQDARGEAGRAGNGQAPG